MKTLSKMIIAIAFTFTTMLSVAQAQAIKVGVNVVNTEYNLNPIDAVEYFQGVSAELNARAYQQNKDTWKGFRVGGVFNYKRDSFDFPTDTYSFGPELSYRVSFVEPFGRVLFGFDTTYNNDKTFTREYQVGARLNFGNLYVEPIRLGWKRTEGFASPSTQQIYSGVGIQF